jgi:hypothetical protein
MANPWDFDTVWATECDDYPTFEGSECSQIISTSACVNVLATVFQGLEHLEGKEVAILADGQVLPRQVVTGGQIELDNSYGLVHIGLPYNSDFKTLPLEVYD